jgi:TRAP-type mannitol/chloroaromatic compound transport system permease small subunit
MGAVSLVSRLANSLDRFAERTGRTVAWLALLLVLVTFGVVVLRYLFAIGSIALQEAILYLHASLFLLGAAYTLKVDGHVRVDIVYRRLSDRGQALVDLLGALFLLLPVCGFMLWISWDYVATAWSLREGSRETGGLPYVYLLKTLIPLASGLLILQGVSQALHSLAVLTAHHHRPT